MELIAPENLVKEKLCAGNVTSKGSGDSPGRTFPESDDFAHSK
jgi:hypothetical protein